jgi:aerobic-type carbon monoxide dehydrogenase small subunit (CoxS/CutS family)
MLHMAIFQLSVNGQLRAVTIASDVPLLWVLRDTLGLRGTKFGCGRGICGACTVHVDGAAIRSCVTPVGSVARQRITTIEGLGASGLHPLQQAWIEEDVPQCGYCQAGQIMMAASLLAVKPHPTDQDILDAMSNNLCRCGTYLRIRRAIRRAAGSPPPATTGQDVAAHQECAAAVAASCGEEGARR